MRERELEGATILLVALLAPTSLYAAAQNPPPPVASVYWTETSVQDFRDGELDPMMFVSPRAQLDPDPGCVEFFARFDVDNNGYYDLVCADDSGPWLHLYFGSAAGYSPTNCRRYPVPGGGNIDLADLNLDGWAELIHSGWRSGHVTIYWGTDSGPSPSDTTWLQLSGQSEAVAVYDLDRDSYLDILAGSDNGNLYIFWGAASGYSSSRRSSVYLNGQIGHNLEVADFDRDGFGDIAASLWSRNRAAIIYWGAARTPREIVWLPVSPNNPHGITVADLNEDNWLDIVLTGYDTVTTAFIYYGSESGFSDTRRELIHPGQCYGGSAAVAWNSDKTLDLVFFRGDWGRTNTYRPRVFFNRLDTTPHFSDSRYSEIGELAFNASGGLAADLNYDGYLDLFVNNMLPDSASFVLWGPGFVNATPLPVDRDHHGVWREPGNIYTRGFNASYLSSVFDIGPDSVISSGTCSWTAREPAGAAVGIEVRSGRTPEPDSSWTDFYPITFNGGTLPATVTGRRFLQYRCRFSYTRPCNLPHLERISFELNRAAAVDVGVLAILAPTGTVDSGTVITPSAVVRNYQNSNPEIRVRLTIGSTYAATIVDTLLPSQTDTLFFPAWTATPPGLHPVRCSVYAHYDDNPANDTLSTTVMVRAESDVGPVAILSPPVVAESGSTHTPSVTVRNFGTRLEQFPVHLRIGSSYNQVVTETLPPGTTDTIFFPTWTASPVGLIPVRCSTGLTRDANRANDTISRITNVTSHIDAAALAILAPTGTIDSGTVITPRARITNLGSSTAVIPVRMRIGSDYSRDTSALVQPAETLTVNFPNWTASPLGTHTVKCSTMLAGDTITSNNSVSDSVRVVAYLNAAAITILAPTGTIDSGTVVVPVCSIANFSTTTQNIPVRLTISTGYSSTRTKLLAPGQSDTVGFTPWLATPVGIHTVRCSTMLSNDRNPADDTVSTTVNVRPLIDAAAITILAPTGTIDSGTTITPIARIGNNSTSTRLIPTRLRIGSNYDQTVSKLLLPGTTDTIHFPAWTASPVGLIPVRCSTGLANDANPTNDTISTQVMVTARTDVGVLAILAPTGTVDSGTVITPSAVVRNYQNSNPEIRVRLTIGSTYAATIVDTLLPSQTDTLFFPAWTATPPGLHPVRCSVYAHYDDNPANDTLSTTVRVRVRIDAAAVLILAPVGVVDSGTTTSPQALVANKGTRSGFFPVHMTIGLGYRESTTVMLAPDSSTTVSFPLWRADEVGTFRVCCSTALSDDVEPTNDTAIAFVAVANRHDASCHLILSPTGVLDSGSVVIPSAMVTNAGTCRELIPVVMRIGDAYLDTAYVSLAPGESLATYFNSWTASPTGLLTVRCSTALSEDRTPANDMATDSVFVTARPDAAVTDIYLPVGVVDSGTTIVPLARICNYGTSPAEVPVRMRIGESYDEVSYKFLGVGAKDTVQFPAWVASPPGVHAVVCSSAISGDVRPENDRRIDSVRVATTVDAGIVAILTPQGRVDSGTAVVPLAIVANYGTSPAFIPVRMQIGSDFDSMVFKMVRPGTEDTVEFPFWLASPVGTIPVRCSTAMPGDLFSGNDYLTSSVTVGVSVDAACLGIEIPDGTVDSGATVIPLVRVANYSTSRKEIPVLLRIGNDYLRGRRKQLDPGTSDTVSFPPWSAQPRGVVALTCSTALYGDERTKNDCVRKSVLVYSHLDAAVLDILVPVGGVDSGRQVTPKARIANYGTAPAVIPAEFRIGDFYRSGRSKLISPGVAETVHFDVWTAAELGRHTVRCTTLLDRDCDPANDTREAEVYVQWRDAGCIAILSPPGIVRAGDTVCPKARVRNFGMIPECIPVVFRYGSLYASLRHTDTLAPGDSAELEFPALIAESSAISASCSTALYYDMHAPNDKLTFTVFGAVRRVVIEPDTAASAPPGGIVNYFLTCRNEGNADDTIDITSQRTRTGWKVELLDSATLEPLADLNNNGLPDVSHLPVGGSSSLVCRLTLPAGEQGLVIDTTELVAASGADPRVTDMCRTSTTVQAFSGLVIEPDQFCLIPPGRPYDYIFTITNLGNVEDYADIAFFCTKGRWRHELLDRDGKSLGDRNANGRRDIGPLSPHSGTTELKLRLTPDSRAQVGERDTTSITIQSFADIGITDTACAVSEVSGAVSGLVVEPDQTTSVNVGATIGIPLWVETSGEIRAIINIAAVCSRPGWQLRLLDAAEKEELRDTDFDSLPDLGFVTPAIRTHFVLQVTAPGCEQLVANADSLPATVTVVASLSGEPTLCDTARVVVVPVPNFEVHNAANPFSERTRFIFSTPTRGRVSLLIYNRLGEIVRTLVKDADCESGIYSTEWDGTNDLGRRLAPGIYVYVFEVTPATGATRRLVRKAVLKR